MVILQSLFTVTLTEIELASTRKASTLNDTATSSRRQAMTPKSDKLPIAKPTFKALHQPITIRNRHTYLHLTLLASSYPIHPSNLPPIDILTARTYLTSALDQFLGMTGTAIPIDFLKVKGRDIWIRVPREDGAAVVGALSQWIGKDDALSFKVSGKGFWLGAVVAGDGQDLFRP